MLSLLFVRRPLENLRNKPLPANDAILPEVPITPLGTCAGIRESQLELLQMPYVNELGKVGSVPMKRLYLDQVLEQLASKLRMDTTNLFDGSREFTIAANDVETGKECCPCYCATTKDQDDKENLQRLESDVIYCLDHQLESLPPDILQDWMEKVLHPLFAQIRKTVMNTYEVIGKLPLLRKRFGFYRKDSQSPPFRANSGKLSFGFYYRRVEGMSLIGLRRTATSEEEARKIAAEMLASERGFESVVIQNPQDPEKGAIEFSIEKSTLVPNKSQ